MQKFPRTDHKKLSFHGSHLITGRHRIHPYPAMLHPLLVGWLIDKYAHNHDLIFDPFCGSGVTLVEAGIKGHDSIGFDINPLALLIAKTKTQTYHKVQLLEEFNDLKDTVYCNKETDIPPIKNAYYWYSESVINDLGRIRQVLKNKPYIYKDFFTTSFAFICRNQSYTRNGEFKRYRMSREKMAITKNEVFNKFFSHISDMIKVFLETDAPTGSSKPVLVNTEDKISLKIKYDLIITSPPYGDSGTTVAYGQYTSFGSEWINGLNSYSNNDCRNNGYQIDREGLGKFGKLNFELESHKLLMSTIEKIKYVDSKRADEVFHFFNGYFNAIRNVVANLNENGRVCFVVGNRTVKGFQIPMDQITASFFESMGLNFGGILVREIHNKVMPLKNSPSNKAGMKSGTMMNEYVVVFSKG